MPKFLAWWNSTALLVLSLALIIFIPLWPKIPLWQPIPGYIVRVRLEDVLVGMTGLVFIWQVLRKQATLNTPLSKKILTYLGVGALSLLSAFFLVQSLPTVNPHVSKALLHWLRYIEYFLIFFFVYNSIRKPQHVKVFLTAFLVVIVGSTVYGFGQKYWRWPVYSTMNFEFSAGIPLELINPQSRVPSTFAGHYDFAIYLNLVLPFVLALLYLSDDQRHAVIFKKRSCTTERFILSGVFLLGLWGLIVSGLRSAFASYVIMVGVLTLLFALKKKHWQERSRWFITRGGVVGVVTVVMFLIFGHNLLALLSHAASGLLSLQTQSISQTIISQYQLPVPKDQVDEYLARGGTEPAELSGCALQREVSLCIRLESLWPQAVTGFMRNPLLGSGYSSLNKRDFTHLSEADGTDNNYLRLLGETGIAGFLSFLAIIACAVHAATRKLKGANEHHYLAAAYITMTVGVLFNALLFDVFSASKVAFGFWGITGLCLGAWRLEKVDK